MRAVLKGSGRSEELVLVENSRLCQQDFPSVQKFVTFDLGLTLLPVGGQREAAQLISQSVSQPRPRCPPPASPDLLSDALQVDGRENPFSRRPSLRLLDPLVLGAVQQVPGLGRVKAVALLQRWGSIQQLCNAAPAQLEPTVGQAAALQLHRFFHSPTGTPPRRAAPV